MAAVSAGYIGPADASFIPIEPDDAWPVVDPARISEGRAKYKTIDFDALEFTSDELCHFILEMMRELNLISKLGVNEARFKRFIATVRGNYQKNPYHNWFHAVDVTQTVFAFLWMSGQADNGRFSDLQRFALLCSALCHDIDHPGVNNMFLVQNKAELALLYNDVSVLENHHCARMFFLLSRKELNFLESWSKEDFKTFRTVCTNCVLATDMARHKEFTDKMAALVEDPKGAAAPENDGLLLQVFLKCADISNVVKPFPVAKKWAVRVTTEFYCQGDREKYYGMDVTPMCDPTKGTRTGSQVGFIDFVVLNVYKAFCALFPGLNPCLDNCQSNKETWKTYTDQQLLSEYPVPQPDP